jgi:predicted unusual protein kinase regulating ubiquinone biosynthesis (AarF/ABC1/UbiB family)
MENVVNVEQLKQRAMGCGAVGIKFLQFITMQNTVVSQKNKHLLMDVFEHCCEHPWEYTAAVYKQQFRQDMEDDFDMSDESCKIPIGSGSIGQVYKLYHKGLQRHVAVKVKHPGVVDMYTRFVRNVTCVLGITERFVNVPFSVLVKEFIHNIEKQMDYYNEAKNTTHLRTLFANEESIVIPTIYSFRQDIIIMSYHDGVPFYDLTCPYLRNKVSFELYLFLMTSFISFDFTHCDLHYGNFKVQLDPQTRNGFRLVVYDCGIVSTTNRPEVNKDIILHAFAADYVALAKLMASTPLSQQPNGKKVLAKLTEMHDAAQHQQVDNSDVMNNSIKQLMIHNVLIDTDILRSTQGVMIAMNVAAICTDNFTKLMQSNKKSREVITVYNHAMLKRLGIYREMERDLWMWIDSDPTMLATFYDWLEEAHGHRDIDVFIDAMLKLQFNIKPLTR